MSRVSFAKKTGRMRHPQHGMSHDHRFIACDLARPASELACIGALMSSVAWIQESMVVDGTLYIRNDHNVPFLLQERALYHVLDIARGVLAEGLAVIPGEREKPAPTVEINEDVYCARPNAYVQCVDDHRRPEKYAVPAGCYEPTMMVVERQGRLQGHMLVSERHDDSRRSLAVHLIDLLTPEAGVQLADRQVFEEMYLARRVDGIEDLGAACLRIGGGMIAAMKDRVRKLQYEGRPTAFLDEDDDARDVLLGLMADGATLTRSRIEEDEYDFFGREPTVGYALDDGSEAPHHVVQRLREAGLVIPSDGRWGESPTLVAVEGLTREQLRPREKTVSFDMFQNACRFRRHPDDGEHECVSARHHGYNSYCEAEACPLLDRVHENEFGDAFGGRRPIRDDPAFNRHDLDERPDSVMVARHPNTRRSYAWRYAGESRIHGIINQVLGAHFTCGIPMLVEAMHDAAVDQAVAEGWVVVNERSPLGSVTQVTEKLLDEVRRHQAGSQEGRQEPVET